MNDFILLCVIHAMCVMAIVFFAHAASTMHMERTKHPEISWLRVTPWVFGALAFFMLLMDIWFFVKLSI